MAEVQAGYDDLADVLYLSIGKPDRRARSRSDEHGLIWRRLPEGRYVGVTVQNVRSWRGRMDELKSLIAERMPEAVKVPELA